MASMVSYKTLLGFGQDEIIINKSRFIGSAAPASCEEEALSFLAQIRAQHKGASHNCYAYIIGQNAGLMRYSDDGEPGGTAGLPMMGVLTRQEVTDCVLVVTRYFGGILLGAGGLVRAYTQGATIGLAAAQVAVKHLSHRYLVEIAYPHWDRVLHYLKSTSFLQEEVSFGQEVTLTLLLRANEVPIFLQNLDRLCDGGAQALLVEEIYAPWADEVI